ncbi:hypothetical protein N7488_002380 [Penicillium malachiteum]|nr:hypothetical protein N7488_002380 [Penicillium malachiteum]
MNQVHYTLILAVPLGSNAPVQPRPWAPHYSHPSLATYTLYSQIESAYKITDGNPTDKIYNNDEWINEYERFCYLPLNST